MMKDFTEKYEIYTKYMQAQFRTVEKYGDYKDYRESIVDEPPLTENDFFRYKSKHFLSENQFWNGLVESKKAQKSISKQINQSLKGKIK